MKLSSETLNVLHNFATINSNLEFKKGKVLKTISPGKGILATATLGDEFEDDFCVVDLNQFLVVYNLNKETELHLTEKDIVFKAGRSKINYRKTERSNCILPPEKELVLPSVELEIKISEQDFVSIMKSASVLKSSHIIVETDKDNKNVLLTACDPSDDSAHVNSIHLGENTTGVEFEFAFSVDNMRMITGEYDLKVCSKGLAQFKNTKVNIEYFVAMEKKYSSYDNKKVS
jgi:gp45 sliding clamp, C terminal